MKRCPNCQRTYPDDAPNFCVNDGTQLINEEAQAFDPQKTILASAPPPPPQPQYSNPPPPIANQPPPQPAWPPPPPQQHGQQQQAQNWGGGYNQQPMQQHQPYGAPYAPTAGQSNKLSLTALITGCVSGLLGLILFLDYARVIRVLDRDSAYAVIIAAVVTGAIALVIGALALISARQRSKALAIVGMVLSAASIGFYIYLEVEYGIFF